MTDPQHAVETQLELLSRGLSEEKPAGSLKALLEEGRPLRVKLGLDPTASRVHLGWAVVLRKLRQFQEMGHTAVLIVGDYTAQVGDPTGKSATRKRLSAEEVNAYAEQCLARVGEVLLPERLEVRYNSEWFGSTTMEGILKLLSTATVSQILERDDFTKRLRENRPISMVELIYPLMQAYDSVMVQSDIELGGSDQLFNNLQGRRMQEQFGMRGQAVCTVPLLVGLDGTQKMSQSLGNFIAIDEPADEMFGKLMSVPDALTVDYARLAAWWPNVALDGLARSMEAGGTGANQAKRSVARDIVDLYHGTGAGDAAEAEFDRRFRDHQDPTDMPELAVADLANEAGAVPLTAVIAAAFQLSTTEARRRIDQGAVKLGGEPVTDVQATFGPSELRGQVLRAGKRNFVRLV